MSNTLFVVLFFWQARRDKSNSSVDSGCQAHMTENLKLLNKFLWINFWEREFGKRSNCTILAFGDLVQELLLSNGFITSKGLIIIYSRWFNLYAELEVAFGVYILNPDLKGNDLLTGSRGTYLYSITLQDSTTPNPICLMAKATSSQAWLWHRHLSHLNFDTSNLLSKYNIVNGLPKLKFVKDSSNSSCD
ncbi:retrovirus-related pol polyprotein from transposon TNT 1-94 [Tanacetum coccineum]